MKGDRDVLLTVEEIFADFKARRFGLIRALTTESDEFYEQCHPEKENLCLYALRNGQWEVSLPVEEVPPELPEPPLGINYSRDAMPEQEWLILVAMHSEAWLIAVAYFFGTRCHLDKADRHRLFDMINEFPTVSEVVVQAQTGRSILNECCNLPDDESSSSDEDEESSSSDDDGIRRRRLWQTMMTPCVE